MIFAGYMRNLRPVVRATMNQATLSAIFLLFLGDLAAQPTNSASIAGKVLEDNGTPVRAIVTASSGTFVQRAFAVADGSFELAKLPAGPYLLCAQIPSMLVGPKDDPFIDSCASPDISSPIALAAAQTRTGVIVRAKRGYLLKVRVNDPGKLLPAPNTKDGGNALRISLVNSAGLHQSIPITSQDPGGRTHGIVIPYGSPHSLFIQGAGFALQDSAGRGLDGVTPVSVTASPGGPSQAYVVNVMKAVKP